jgi:hypothetical protein
MPMDQLMKQFLCTLLAYAYFGFLFVGYYLYTFCWIVLELAGFRRAEPKLEADKAVYPS